MQFHHSSIMANLDKLYHVLPRLALLCGDDKRYIHQKIKRLKYPRMNTCPRSNKPGDESEQYSSQATNTLSPVYAPGFGLTYQAPRP